jgi:hypothetical protein
MEVKSPETSEIAVKFRNPPPVRLKDLTPQIAFDWSWEGSVIPAEERPLDDHNYLIDGLTIGFSKGVVTEVRFSESRGLVVIKDGKELKFPMSKRAFEALFGPPISTKMNRQWN